MRHNSCEMQLAVLHFGECADGNLTAAAKFVQTCALPICRSAGLGIVEKLQMLAHLYIALANLDAQGSLSRSRTHKLCRQVLFHQLRFAQTCQSGSSQNDGVILALFEFTDARIDVPSQRMNYKVRAKRLQLRLTPQAAGADLCAFGQGIETLIVD